MLSPSCYSLSMGFGWVCLHRYPSLLLELSVSPPSDFMSPLDPGTEMIVMIVIMILANIYGVPTCAKHKY